MKVTYRIVEHDGGWADKLDDVFSESFATHDKAVAAARAVAREQQVENVDIVSGGDDQEDLFAKPERANSEDELNRGLEQSFPASDPLAVEQAGNAGAPAPDRRARTADRSRPRDWSWRVYESGRRPRGQRTPPDIMASDLGSLSLTQLRSQHFRSTRDHPRP